MVSLGFVAHPQQCKAYVASAATIQLSPEGNRYCANEQVGLCSKKTYLWTLKFKFHMILIWFHVIKYILLIFLTI